MSKRARGRAALRVKFLASAVERLVALDNVLLALEADPHNTTMRDQLMRDAHTLKGEARLMALHDIATVAHEVEEVILAADRVGLEHAEGVVDDILAGVGALRRMVLAEQGEEIQAPKVEETVAAMRAAMARMGVGPAAEGEAPSPQGQEAKGGAEQGSEGESVPVSVSSAGGARPPRGAAAEPAKLDEWFLGQSQQMRVPPERLEELARTTAQLMLTQQSVIHGVKELSRRMNALSQVLVAVESQLGRVREPKNASRESLENLLTALRESAKEWAATRAMARRADADVRERLFDASIAHEELQGSVGDLRLQPIASLFEPFPGAARQLLRAQKKLGRVVVEGSKVSLDRRVIAALGEPLLHLVRNSIDHGVEPPERRLLAGKSSTATLRLAAEQEGSFVVITVEDDGRGIDRARLRDRALKTGLASAGELESMDEQALLQLIFRPGLSTKEVVSEISGRGVGLDVVARTLERVGGRVTVESTEGVGTRFALRVPAAMLLQPVLIARAGVREFAINAQRVRKVIDWDPSAVERAGHSFVQRVGEEYILLVDVATTLGDSPREPASQEGRCVLVVESMSRTLGLVASEVIGQIPVLRKPLGGFLEGSPILEGVAVTESGKAVLLLDVDRLVERTPLGSGLDRRAEKSVEVGADIVLVVDDSEVTRELVASTLRTAGFKVLEAVNGRDAMNRLRNDRPKLIVSDLEMPLLDGWGLLSEVRSSAELGEIPVVMFTTRGSNDDKRKGAELGASAYLVKGDFDEDTLINTVRRLMPGGDA